jgi:hypothetical protein
LNCVGPLSGMAHIRTYPFGLLDTETDVLNCGCPLNVAWDT